jgi:aspartyl-tRNA(Asn)/glutamyl-tRNA(Gln) amidotransferase subunit C
MADLSLHEVEELALLARLELGPGEADKMRSELAAILGYVSALAAVDVTGVEAMTHAVPMACPLRPDVVEPSLPVERALAQAPAHQDDGFEVPRIIEKSNA